MVSTLIWNIRTALDRLKFLKVSNNISIIAILEPKAKGNKLHNYKRALGFSQAFNNINNKIWLFCNDSLDCTIVDDQEQVLSCSLKGDNGVLSVFSIVYAKTKSKLREPLWDDLRRLANSINQPWCIVGDFNCITEASEKQGGTPHKPQKAMPFINCIVDCDLIDMDYPGPIHTWCNDWAPQREFGKGLIELFIITYGLWNFQTPQ